MADTVGRPFLLDPRNAELASGDLRVATRHARQMISLFLIAAAAGTPLLWLLWRSVIAGRAAVLAVVALFATISGVFLLWVVGKAIVFYRGAAVRGQLLPGVIVKAEVFRRGSSAGRQRMPSLDVEYEAVSPSGARVTGSKKVLRSDLSEAPAPGTLITVLFVGEKHSAL